MDALFLSSNYYLTISGRFSFKLFYLKWDISSLVAVSARK